VIKSYYVRETHLWSKTQGEYHRLDERKDFVEVVSLEDYMDLFLTYHSPGEFNEEYMVEGK
jgi:hypothetical protein